MQQTWQTALYQAAALTFEELCFMLLELEADGLVPETSPEATVRVIFSGPWEGTLWIRLYGDLLPELAANMLGEEAPPAAFQQHDALREVANVVCGNVLPSIAGSQAIFRIGTPEIVCPPETPANEQSPLVAVTQIALDQGQVVLQLFAAEAIPVATEEHKA